MNTGSQPMQLALGVGVGPMAAQLITNGSVIKPACFAIHLKARLERVEVGTGALLLGFAASLLSAFGFASPAVGHEAERCGDTGRNVPSDA